uniref:Uncharacterized protein n=1 Tax=Knipowitschia caucasica TaxID=637954 RepID=A0AAV2KGQ4_KNICA
MMLLERTPSYLAPGVQRTHGGGRWCVLRVGAVVSGSQWLTARGSSSHNSHQNKLPELTRAPPPLMLCQIWT